MHTTFEGCFYNSYLNTISAISFHRKKRYEETIDNIGGIDVATSGAVAPRVSTNSEANISQDLVEPTGPISYQGSSATHLRFSGIVDECTRKGADAEAIDIVTHALIHDNATLMSLDLASFCLTTLWLLARKSDKNRRKIIFDDASKFFSSFIFSNFF